MKVPAGLSDLDQRVLPRAATRLRRWLDAGHTARRGALGRADAALRRAGTAVGGWGRRVDERFASGGPLGLVREVPQLALLLVAAVFVSGAFAAVHLAEPDRPAPSSLAARSAPLGVPAGTDVDGYLDDARDDLERLADDRPDARHLALVSLADYATVADVERLADGVEVQRVYLRAPGVDDAEVVEVPLAGIRSAQVLPALCAATRTRKEADAASLRELVGTIAPTTTDEEEQRVQLTAQAEVSAAEATAFGGDCRTVFALVVEGRADALEALLDRPGVRGVEAAEAGLSVLELDVSPLLPETTGTAPGGAQR